MASGVARVRKAVSHLLDRKFRAWARVVAALPLLVCLCSLVVFGGLSAGLTTLREEARNSRLYVPTQEKAYLNWQDTIATFGDREHALIMYAVRTDGSDIFDKESIKQLMRAHEWVTSRANITFEGKKLFWKDVCKKFNKRDDCKSKNFLALWNYDADLIDSPGRGIKQMLNLYNSAASIRTFAGGVQYADEDETKVLSAKAVSFTYRLNGVDGAPYDFQGAYDDGIEDSVDKSVLTITHFSNRAYDVETQRLVSGDIPIFAAGINVIWIFLALTLGPIHSLVKSRVLLAPFAAVNVLLAIGAGFGVAALAGVPFVSISSLLALILLGVEVDGVIILVDYLNSEPASDPIADRIERAVSKAGQSILITSLTSISAFAVGAATDLPAVSMFCTYAALAFTFAFFAIMTFFLPILVLDEHRLQQNRVSFFPLVVVDNSSGKQRFYFSLPSMSPSGGSVTPPSVNQTPVTYEDVQRPRVPPGASDDEEGAPTKQKPVPGAVTVLQRLVRDYYAPAVLSPVGATLVLLAFAAMAGLSGGFVNRMELGLSDSAVIPDDSFIQKALITETEEFGGRLLNVDVVLKNVDFNSASERRKVAEAWDDILNLDFVFARVDNWQAVYEAARDQKPTYLNDLHGFLERTDGAAAFDSVNCTFQNDLPYFCAARAVRYNVIYSKGTGTSADVLQNRAQLEKQLVDNGLSDSYAFVQDYLFAETNTIIWELTLTSMGYALIAIIALMLVFVTPTTALWVVLCVALIDLNLLGIMIACGIALNTVSFVNLVMSIGLSVDYCVHVGHVFDHEWETLRGKLHPEGRLYKPRDATAIALQSIGGSVIKGGFTTFLGLCAVAFASSVAFRTFFTLIAFTVVLGVLHGMVLMPVLLAYGTPVFKPKKGGEQ